jgi:hypothetical protein
VALLMKLRNAQTRLIHLGQFDLRQGIPWSALRRNQKCLWVIGLFVIHHNMPRRYCASALSFSAAFQEVGYAPFQDLW